MLFFLSSCLVVWKSVCWSDVAFYFSLQSCYLCSGLFMFCRVTMNKQQATLPGRVLKLETNLLCRLQIPGTVKIIFSLTSVLLHIFVFCSYFNLTQTEKYVLCLIVIVHSAGQCSHCNIMSA